MILCVFIKYLYGAVGVLIPVLNAVYAIYDGLSVVYQGFNVLITG